MNDLISRQDAIDAIVAWTVEDRPDIEMPTDLIDRISNLPSAERMGKWQEVYAETDYRNGWIEFSCECCEHQHGLESGEYGWHYGDEIPWKYCPLCGAKMDMRGEEDA